MLLGLRKSRTGTPPVPPSTGSARGEAPQLNKPEARAGTGTKRLPGEAIPRFKASSLLRAQIIYCFGSVQVTLPSGKKKV